MSDMTAPRLDAASPKFLQTIAPGLFVLLWATGFLTARFGIPYAGAMTLLTLRFSFATAMMLVVALVTGARWPRSLKVILHLVVTGVLLQAVYLGGCYAAIYAGMPAGMAALIAGFQPILTAVLAGPLLQEHLRGRQWFGILLGFCGLVLVIWDKLQLDLSHLWGLFFAILSLLGITGATLYQKLFVPKVDLRSNAVIQYGAATLTLLPVVAWLGVGEVHWELPFILCMIWMVVVLSGISIALLTWMIQHGAASKVSSLFYLTPPAAAFGAYLCFGETLGWHALAGMVVVAVAIILVNRR
ncbi:MAG: DMT family transporter [Rhodospirillaceae bacterium]|nr:MAG: DMT family transporter [Rhodospirillaceae bacterium]